MDLKRKKMIDLLKILRSDYNLAAVKAEFEAEGVRTDEMIMLNEVVFRADADLNIKIGGCEAVRDMDQCRLLGASGIMGPMIETPFAMRKFREAANKVYEGQLDSVNWIINAETITCYENLDTILQEGTNFLNTVVVGRSDFSGSLEVKREDINNDSIFEYSKNMLQRARKAGYKASLGGAITLNAIPFLLNIYPYIDECETRKIVFKAMDDEKMLREGILKALEFEIAYLELKCDFYNRLAKEDAKRLSMLRNAMAK